VIIGDPLTLALESEITVAYARPSHLALGFFAIHVAGASYGVRAPDATMLGCSFDEVGRRIEERGQHVAPFAKGVAAGPIADAVCRALYADSTQGDRLFGYAPTAFAGLVYAGRLLWAPDGDEAFDDGSHVLQIDEEESVRVIAFKKSGPAAFDQGTLREVHLAAEDFYGLLESWKRAFEIHWEGTPKASATTPLP